MKTAILLETQEIIYVLSLQNMFHNIYGVQNL